MANTVPCADCGKPIDLERDWYLKLEEHGPAPSLQLVHPPRTSSEPEPPAPSYICSWLCGGVLMMNRGVQDVVDGNTEES